MVGGGFHESMRAWEPEEDQVIAAMIAELGPRWSRIVSRLPGRSVSSVRNRWQRISKGRSIRSQGITTKNRCQLCGEPKRGHVCPARASRTGNASNEDAAAIDKALEVACKVMQNRSSSKDDKNDEEKPLPRPPAVQVNAVPQMFQQFPPNSLTAASPYNYWLQSTGPSPDVTVPASIFNTPSVMGGPCFGVDAEHLIEARAVVVSNSPSPPFRVGPSQQFAADHFAAAFPFPPGNSATNHPPGLPCMGPPTPMGAPPAAFQPRTGTPPLGGTPAGAASSVYQYGHMSPTSASTGTHPFFQSRHLSPPNHPGHLSPPNLSGGYHFLPDRPPLEHSGSSFLNMSELGLDMIPVATSVASVDDHLAMSRLNSVANVNNPGDPLTALNHISSIEQLVTVEGLEVTADVAEPAALPEQAHVDPVRPARAGPAGVPSPSTLTQA